MVQNLPTMQEPRVCSLGQEDSLEKERATHSSILAWRITVHGVQRFRHDLVTKQQQQQNNDPHKHIKLTHIKDFIQHLN